jgi:subtilisin family serine protease
VSQILRRVSAPLLVALAVALGAALLLQPRAEAQATNSVAGRYIVVFAPSVADPGAETDALLRAHGGTLHYRYSHALRGFAASMSDAAVDALRHNPRVASVTPDGVVQISDSGTQSPVPSWGLDRIDQRTLPLSGSYAYTTGASLKAYIIDTGIRTSHADFGERAIDGYDAVDGTLPAADCNGHGTHVAGTVGGNSYGVAKNVTLVAVRVLNCQGSGTYSGVIAGIDWVTGDHQPGVPAVANMSLGGGAYDPVDQAVANSIADGVTYAIAAGNSNANACNYSPARTPAALTVGATTSSDAEASYSNYGACVDILAPGSSITSAWSTSDTATNTISGTSMATPHVAGAAALYLEANPGASPAAVASALVSAATSNVITLYSASASAGTPNKLLYTGSTAPVAPGAPVLSASAGDSVANLSWATPSDGGSAITGYRIYRGTSVGGETLLVTLGVTNSYADNAVTNGTTYYYRVSAMNSVGEGALSNEVSVTPQAPASVTVPSAPQNLSAAQATGKGVQLSWQAPTSDGGSAITGYRVYRGGALIATTTSLNYKDTATKRGTNYCYTVAAVNSVGVGTPSTQSCATAK